MFGRRTSNRTPSNADDLEQQLAQLKTDSDMCFRERNQLRGKVITYRSNENNFVKAKGKIQKELAVAKSSMNRYREERDDLRQKLVQAESDRAAYHWQRDQEKRNHNITRSNQKELVSEFEIIKSERDLLLVELNAARSVAAVEKCQRERSERRSSESTDLVWKLVAAERKRNEAER